MLLLLNRGSYENHCESVYAQDDSQGHVLLAPEL